MRQRRFLIPALALLVGALLALPAIGLASSAHKASKPATKSTAAKPPTLHFETGFGSNDFAVLPNKTYMFQNALYTGLHTKIVRYIAPYDAALNTDDEMGAFEEWAKLANADHEQILVAFYHSEQTNFTVPTLAKYTIDVKKFVAIAKTLGVREYQPWDEVNRGHVSGAGGSNSPTPTQSAQFYKAMLGFCSGCTLVGLDVLDQEVVGPTLTYIKQFQAALAKLKVSEPHIWGLHNYSDVNRFSMSRTKAILAVLPKGSEVWLTETGGIVQLGTSLSFSDSRANRATAYMFKIANAFPQIKRLYIYTWPAAPPSERFDAGVIDLNGVPRPSYVTICKTLLGNSAPLCVEASKIVDSTH